MSEVTGNDKKLLGDFVSRVMDIVKKDTIGEKEMKLRDLMAFLVENDMTDIFKMSLEGGEEEEQEEELPDITNIPYGYKDNGESK